MRTGDKQWVLHIYSPTISEKFKLTKEQGDIYEQRRLTFYALMNSFPNDYAVKRLFTWDDEIQNAKSKSAALIYNSKGMKGVTVYTFKHKDDAIKMDEKFDFSPDTGLAALITGYEGDRYYPVDVKLYNISNGGWDGSEYYKDNDFKGLEVGGGYTVLFGGSKDLVGVLDPLAEGKGIILGYMRGYGLVYYDYSVDLSLGLDISANGTGIILNGKFITKDIDSPKFYDGETYGPYSLSGYGLEVNAGIYIISSTHWKSLDSQGNVIWSGTGIGGAFGKSVFNGKTSFSINLTKSELIFPKWLRHEK